MAAHLIPLDACVPGGIYILFARDLRLGVFDGGSTFVGIRSGCGRRSLDTERHVGDLDRPAGTAHPLVRVAGTRLRLVSVRSLAADGTPQMREDYGRLYRRLRDLEHVHRRAIAQVNEPEDFVPCTRCGHLLVDHVLLRAGIIMCACTCTRPTRPGPVGRP